MLWILDNWRDHVRSMSVWRRSHTMAMPRSWKNMATRGGDREVSAELTAGSKSHRCHIHLGNLLFENGETADAKDHVQKASTLNPKLAQSHNYLGKVFMREGNSSQAIGQFEEAPCIHPDFPEAEENLRVAKETSAQSP
jgi:Flp pilus assembly protein TadD